MNSGANRGRWQRKSSPPKGRGGRERLATSCSIAPAGRRPQPEARWLAPEEAAVRSSVAPRRPLQIGSAELPTGVVVHGRPGWTAAGRYPLSKLAPAIASSRTNLRRVTPGGRSGGANRLLLRSLLHGVLAPPMAFRAFPAARSILPSACILVSPVIFPAASFILPVVFLAAPFIRSLSMFISSSATMG